MHYQDCLSWFILPSYIHWRVIWHGIIVFGNITTKPTSLQSFWFDMGVKEKKTHFVTCYISFQSYSSPFLHTYEILLTKL